ncbi:hypothetical protein [Streptomyces omiyaensis]|uniref:hypothetical protein n=1 Tax=Streptomyces omiyaensis TaxID=68247 RepID=UPI0016767181|nr:hypothetical protein [Streptomyces omiyaensis]GGY62549.1 hypothetical protein GCM10010363_50090 [Streptomyces omiyaensis]
MPAGPVPQVGHLPVGGGVGDEAGDPAGTGAKGPDDAAVGVAHGVGGAHPRTAGPLDADALAHAWAASAPLWSWWIDHPEQSPETMARRCVRPTGAARALFAAGA